jgi:hypothetical protein
MTGERGWGMFLYVLIGKHILIGMKSAFITTSYSEVLNIRTSQLVVRVRTGKTEVPSSCDLLSLPTRRGVSKYSKSS